MRVGRPVVWYRLQNTGKSDIEINLLDSINIFITVKLIILWQVYISQLSFFQLNFLQKDDYGLKASNNSFILYDHNFKAQ